MTGIQPIVITEHDARLLRGLLSAGGFRDQDHLEELRSELERATVMKSEDVADDVVTMHRTVQVLDLESGESQELTLVSPAKANIRTRCISVLAPLGTALLGNRVGDEVEWLMPGGLRRLRIERVSDAASALAGSVREKAEVI